MSLEKTFVCLYLKWDTFFYHDISWTLWVNFIMVTGSTSSIVRSKERKQYIYIFCNAYNFLFLCTKDKGKHDFFKFITTIFFLCHGCVICSTTQEFNGEFCSLSWLCYLLPTTQSSMMNFVLCHGCVICSPQPKSSMMNFVLSWSCYLLHNVRVQWCYFIWTV